MTPVKPALPVSVTWRNILVSTTIAWFVIFSGFYCSVRHDLANVIDTCDACFTVVVHISNAPFARITGTGKKPEKAKNSWNILNNSWNILNNSWNMLNKLEIVSRLVH
jgi:hypothetical protein